MRIEDLVRIIDMINDKSKVVSEVTDVTKSVIAKDPDALNSKIVQYLVKGHLGEPMYDTIQKLYHNIIGMNDADVNPDIVDIVEDRQDSNSSVSSDVAIRYVVKGQGD